MKYLKTVALALTHFSTGATFSGLGPTLPSLAFNLNTSITKLSSVVIGRGFGYLVGSLISGLLHRRLSPYLYLCVGVALLSVGLIVIPFVQNIFILVIIIGLQGLLQGVTDTTGNIILLDLWKEKSGILLNLVKFAFAIGSTLAPFIAAPFLTPLEKTSEELGCRFKELNSSDVTNKTYNLSQPEVLSFKWAYFIYSIVPAITFVLYLYISIKENFKATKLSRKENRRKTLDKNRNEIFCLLFIFFMFYVGMLASMETYLFSFATSCGINFSKDKAIALNTAFFSSFAVARAIGIVFAITTTSTVQMCVNLLGLCTASVILIIIIFLNKTSDWLLFTAFVIFAASFSTLFATAFSWAEQHITVTSMAATIMVSGASLGEMVIPFVIGQIFRFNHLTLIYAVVGFSFIETILFGLLNLFVSKKYVKEETEAKSEQIKI